MFGLVVATIISYLALAFWTFGSAVSSIMAGRPVDGSVLLSVPRPVIWMTTALLILLPVEAVLFLVFSKRRWRNKPHLVRWDIIPNHNIVVAMTAYNDEASIYNAVEEFRSQPDVKEFIVVDNNCTDAKRKLATCWSVLMLM